VSPEKKAKKVGRKYRAFTSCTFTIFSCTPSHLQNEYFSFCKTDFQILK